MDGGSLLSFLDAPCLVGDPNGRVVYANPAFERRFPAPSEGLLGVELVSLFEGGGREAILNAVALVCSGGQTVHFRLREDERGFLGLCSPIEAPGDVAGARVGVVVLLMDEPAPDAKLQSLHGEIKEPLGEGIACLEHLMDQTGGRRDEAFRDAVERGLAALMRAKKWNDELSFAMSGRGFRVQSDARLDPVRLLTAVGSRIADASAEDISGLRLLVPAQLPAARGDTDVLEAALVRLVRLRQATAESGESLTLSARTMGRGDDSAILITLIDQPRGGEEDEDGEPQSLRDAVEPYGGRVHTVRIARVGRATAVRLILASS
jgi:PAS domain-containing protein